MGLTPEETRDLLGAWALDALDPDERGAVDALVAGDTDLERRARALVMAAAHLATPLTTPPPPALRSTLLTAAGRTPQPTAPASSPVDVYEHQARALRRVLSELRTDDWGSAAPPYGWDVHGLVAHLLAIEQLMAATLGLGDPPDAADAAHLEVGAELIELRRRLDPTDTAAAWVAVVDRIVAHLRGPGAPDLDLETPFHGWPFHLGSLLVARGFELWTHADDIRRATRQALRAPEAPDIRTMSDHSVRSLELLQPFVPGAPALGAVRIVLTGDGGGTWDLGPAGTDPVVVVADVVDYCRLASRRIDPAALAAHVEPGGAADVDALLASLFDAARAFAV